MKRGSADNWSADSALELLEAIEFGRAPPKVCPCCLASEHDADCALAWHLAQLRKECLSRPLRY